MTHLSATPAGAVASATRPPATMLVIWRRLRLRMRRDALATVNTPESAVQLADSLLARTAVAHDHTEMWCSVAVSPLAALLAAGSAAGNGRGLSWVRATVAALQAPAPSESAWNAAEAAVGGLSPQRFRAAIPALRQFDPRQRRSLALVMGEALHRLPSPHYAV